MPQLWLLRQQAFEPGKIIDSMIIKLATWIRKVIYRPRTRSWRLRKFERYVAHMSTFGTNWETTYVVWGWGNLRFVQYTERDVARICCDYVLGHMGSAKWSSSGRGWVFEELLWGHEAPAIKPWMIYACGRLQEQGGQGNHLWHTRDYAKSRIEGVNFAALSDSNLRM